MSNVVNFSVFLTAVIALTLVTSGYVAFAIASGIVAFGCAGWVYFSMVEPLRQLGNLADEIPRKSYPRSSTTQTTYAENGYCGSPLPGEAGHAKGKGD